MNDIEIKEIKNALLNNKTEQVLIIYTLMAAAVGFNIDVFDDQNMIINFEENFIEIGVIASGGIIYCKTVPNAADINMTVMIAVIKDILENTPLRFNKKICSEGIYLTGKALPEGIIEVIKKTGLKILV
ncbi:MAG TPA: rod shape-determining protein [Bacteroidales bacterium]|nr:rod shape-determining protein [Bacteroidales bacterium]